MSKKIMISAGGTGGHVFPAMGLAREIQKMYPDSEILFCGGGLETNSFFDRKKFAYVEIPTSMLPKKQLIESLKFCKGIAKGVFSAYRTISRFKPDVIVGFGSYQTFPVLLAARMHSIPLVLHEGNCIPGKVNRYFSRYAEVTGVTFPQAGLYLKGKSIRVQFPLREGYTRAFSSSLEGREYFNLDPSKFTFLVFGGSQGALALNTHFCAAVLDLADRSRNFQVIHLTGNAGATSEIAEFYRELGIQARVKDFEERMDKAWLAADLAIGRAGASTIAEMLQMETPAILVPYPYSTDDHQDENANYVAEHIKGAIKLSEEDLLPQQLATTISELVADNRGKIKTMREQMSRFRQENRSRDLSTLVSEIAGLKVR